MSKVTRSRSEVIEVKGHKVPGQKSQSLRSKVMGSRSKVTEFKVICHEGQGQRGQITRMNMVSLNYFLYEITRIPKH